MTYRFSSDAFTQHFGSGDNFDERGTTDEARSDGGLMGIIANDVIAAGEAQDRVLSAARSLGMTGILSRGTRADAVRLMLDVHPEFDPIRIDRAVHQVIQHELPTHLATQQ